MPLPKVSHPPYGGFAWAMAERPKIPGNLPKV